MKDRRYHIRSETMRFSASLTSTSTGRINWASPTTSTFRRIQTRLLTWLLTAPPPTVSKIHNLNLNLFTTVSPTKLNEAHFSYTREKRPRSATSSNLFADTGAGAGFNASELSFRFGNPFFLQPKIDELLWRTDAKDNFSIISGNHNVKFGGEWLHTLNTQVFRGFFTGRYLFNNVTGFLRYASPAALGPGFGPNTGDCGDGTWTDLTAPTCAGAFTPLLLFLQAAGPSGPATDAAGASSIKNEDYAL